jgi:hypothetical protein
MRNAHEILAPGEGIGSLTYQNGFGSEFGTEVLEGALPYPVCGQPPEGHCWSARIGFGEVAGTVLPATNVQNAK